MKDILSPGPITVAFIIACDFFLIAIVADC